MCCELQRIIMKMKKWSPQWTQFTQLRKEAWKTFRTSTGFEPVTTRFTGAMFYQLSYEITDVGSSSIVVMTSLLMPSLPINISPRIFRWSFSNSRKVHVRVVASSPSFSRLAARAPQRACSQARELSIVWLTYPKHSLNIKFQYFLLS